MNVDQTVRNFRSFIENAWETIVALKRTEEEQEDIISDWLQANWELLVESVIVCTDKGQFIEVYGDGADCNGASSRVWMPDARPSHKIYCKSRTGSSVKDVLSGKKVDIKLLTFGCFVSWDGYKYAVQPPFDHVLLENKNEIVIVPVNQVVFEISHAQGTASD